MKTVSIACVIVTLRVPLPAATPVPASYVADGLRGIRSFLGSFCRLSAASSLRRLHHRGALRSVGRAGACPARS
jgi:hypothetical protein